MKMQKCKLKQGHEFHWWWAHCSMINTIDVRPPIMFNFLGVMNKKLGKSTSLGWFQHKSTPSVAPSDVNLVEVKWFLSYNPATRSVKPLQTGWKASHWLRKKHNYKEAWSIKKNEVKLNVYNNARIKESKRPLHGKSNKETSSLNISVNMQYFEQYSNMK